MKLKFLLPACAAFTFALNSCKKDNTTSSGDIAATFELSGDQAISDNTTEDANQVLNEAGMSNGFLGSFSGSTAATTSSSFTGGTTGIASCAVITVTQTTGNPFPKNIVIDFGAGCTSSNNVTRTGKILVTLTDSLRKSGSVATMTFDNYHVMGYKKEGNITWTNTSTVTVKSWHRVCQNGKITAPSGNYWTHFGAQDLILTAGASTPFDLSDDVWSITGGHTVTNSAGVSRTGTILSALEKKNSCNNIDMGRYQVQGPNHVAVIDYGNGTCDDIATISIDGQTPHTFHLN